MKRPTPASLKKVTPANLARLGAERLAVILAETADARPELKRRLRMELAAEQGAEQLIPEIDKRLDTLARSRGRISWRQRPSFVRDLEALRVLIAERLAGLDRAAALGALLRFMDTAKPTAGRVSDKHGELAAVYARGAQAIGPLLTEPDASAMMETALRNPFGWATWLEALLAGAPTGFAAAALAHAKTATTAASAPLLRRLADAAGDVDAYRASFTDAALRDPSVAAEVGRRLLETGRVEEAGALLAASAPKAGRDRFGRAAPASPPDPDWEGAWIDWLEASGRGDEAQAVRWESFERTLAVERARDFTRRLGDFDDVEAEGRAFAYAARHPDAGKGLAFLVAWPALPEAAAMVEARADELAPMPAEAEAWAAKLRVRYPAAARLLLRKAAAAAFRRRDFKASDRLTAEAETLESA